MSNFNLYIGQTIKLMKDNNDDLKYKAEVIGINDESIDLELLGVSKRKLSSLIVGQDYIITFEGSNDLYELDVKIKKVSNKFNKVIIVIPTGDLRTIERRRYVRVKFIKKINYKLLNSNLDHQALMIDISASGIKIEVDSISDLKMEKKIEINFSNINDFPINNIIGRILRIKVNQNSRGNKRRYYLGIEFVSISKTEREELIDWVQTKRTE